MKTIKAYFLMIRRKQRKSNKVISFGYGKKWSSDMNNLKPQVESFDRINDLFNLCK